MKTLKDCYKEMTSDEDQKKISLTAIAEKLGCMPWQTRELFINQLKRDRFSKSELEEAAKQWANKKIEEGKFFNIKPENTTSAILEKWTIEYKNVKS